MYPVDPEQLFVTTIEDRDSVDNHIAIITAGSIVEHAAHVNTELRKELFRVLRANGEDSVIAEIEDGLHDSTLEDYAQDYEIYVHDCDTTLYHARQRVYGLRP